MSSQLLGGSTSSDSQEGYLLQIACMQFSDRMCGSCFCISVASLCTWQLVHLYSNIIGLLSIDLCEQVVLKCTSTVLAPPCNTKQWLKKLVQQHAMIFLTSCWKLCPSPSHFSTVSLSKFRVARHNSTDLGPQHEECNNGEDWLHLLVWKLWWYILPITNES